MLLPNSSENMNYILRRIKSSILLYPLLESNAPLLDYAKYSGSIVQCVLYLV
jgi:hypothetical protein